MHFQEEDLIKDKKKEVTQKQKPIKSKKRRRVINVDRCNSVSSASSISTTPSSSASSGWVPWNNSKTTNEQQNDDVDTASSSGTSQLSVLSFTT